MSNKNDLVTNSQDYFWMIDRLEKEDDPRNKVDKERNTVTFHKQTASSIKSGYLFSKLLLEMYPTYRKRTKKSFVLDAGVTNIKDNNQLKIKQQNWEVLTKALEPFGVKVDDQRKQDFIDGKNEQISDLLAELADIDQKTGQKQQLLKKATLATGGNQGKPKSVLGSQISGYVSNKQGDGDNPIESVDVSDLRTQIRNQGSLHSLPDRSTDIGGGSDILGEARNHPLSKKRNSNLSPIAAKDFNTPGNKRSTRNNQFANNASQISQIHGGIPKSQQIAMQSPIPPPLPIGKLPAYMQNVGSDMMGDIELPESLADSKTSYQFIVASLANSFDMRSGPASKLMSDNNKGLYKLCIQGSVNGDYTKVQRFYQTMFPHVDTFVRVLQQEQIQQDDDDNSNQTPGVPKASQGKKKRLFRAFNVLKGGFYSKSKDVVSLCGILFTRIGQEINNTDTGELLGEAWDWFTRPTPNALIRQKKSENINHMVGASLQKGSPIGQHLKSIQPNVSPGKVHSKVPNNTNNRQSIQSVGGREPDVSYRVGEFYDHTGLQSIIFAIQQSNDEFIETAVTILVQLGKYNYVELFTQKLIQQCDDWTAYAELCHDLFVATADTQAGRETFEKSGVLSYWITACIKMAENTGEVPLNDRVASLVFVTQIWLQKSDFMARNFPDVTVSLLNVLKRASRDMRQTLVVVSLELLFRLMEQFAQSRNQYAPIIYKTLTFLLVEFFWEIDVRQIMLKYFTSLYSRFKHVPIGILCEPLLKQIQISQFQATSFNVFDFEFFNVVALHPKLSTQIAVLLVDTLSKIALSSVFYYQIAVHTLKIVFNRFSQQSEMVYHWKAQFRSMLTSMLNIETRFEQHRRIIDKEQASFFDKLALNAQRRRGNQNTDLEENGMKLGETELNLMKTNERLIVYQMHQIMMMGNQLLNDEMKQQLLDTYFVMEQNLKIQSKPVKFLLQQFGENMDRMLEDRQMQVNKQMRVHGSAVGRTRKNVTRSPARSATLNMSMDDNNKTLVTNAQGRRVASPQVIKKHQKQFDGTQAVLLNNQVAKALQQQQKAVAEALGQQAVAPGSKLPPQLYDHEYWEEPIQVDKYNLFLKKYAKAYKVLFNMYASLTGNVKTGTVVRQLATFDDVKKENELINTTNLVVMLKDYDLNHGRNPKQVKESVNQIVKIINTQIIHKQGNLIELPFEGFKSFMLQYAFYTYVTANLPKNQRGIVPKVVEAAELITRLFDEMKQNASKKKNKELLRIFQIVEPRDHKAGVLELLTKKCQQDPNYDLPEGYKKIVEKKVVEVHMVPEAVPMKESQVVALELLDGIVFKAFGSHFLEPSMKAQNIVRVKPTVMHHEEASRVLHETLDRAQQNAGDLSQKIVHHEWDIGRDKKHSMLREQNYKEEPIGQHGGANRFRTGRIALGKGGAAVGLQGSIRLNQELPLKAQNLDPVLKLGILEAPQEDKETYLEAAHALEYILKAVSSKDTDYTQKQLKKVQNFKRSAHARLHALHQDRLAKKAEALQAKEEQFNQEVKPPSDDEDEKERKAQMLADHMEVVEERFKEAKEERKALQEKQKQAALEAQAKKERLEQAYKEKQEARKAEAKAAIAARMAKKEAEKKQKEDLDKQKAEEANQAIKDRKAGKRMTVKKAPALIPNQTIESEVKEPLIRQGSLKAKVEEREAAKPQIGYKAAMELAIKEQLEKETKDKQKAERRRETLKLKVEERKEIKETKLQEYADFIDSKPIQDLLSEFEIGLQISFDQVAKLGFKPGAVTHGAWTQFCKQTRLTKDVMTNADAMSAFQSESRLSRTDPGFLNEVIDLPQNCTNQPLEGELGYREFVSALVKLAIIEKSEANPVGPATVKPGVSPGKLDSKKMEIGDYREYSIDGMTADRVRAMFEKLNVKQGVVSIVKDFNEKKEPKHKPTDRHNTIDYLNDGKRNRAGTILNPGRAGLSTSPRATRAGTTRNKKLGAIVETQESVVAFFDAPKKVTVTTKPPLSPQKQAKVPYRQRTGTQQSPTRKGTLVGSATKASRESPFKGVQQQNAPQGSPRARQGTVASPQRQGNLLQKSPSPRSNK